MMPIPMRMGTRRAQRNRSGQWDLRIEICPPPSWSTTSISTSSPQWIGRKRLWVSRQPWRSPPSNERSWDGRCGRTPPLQRALRRARVILLAADGVPSRQIAQRVGIDEKAWARRRRFAAEGLEGLQDWRRPRRPRVYDHDARLAIVPRSRPAAQGRQPLAARADSVAPGRHPWGCRPPRWAGSRAAITSSSSSEKLGGPATQ
jgi:Winged helix-turn helix